MRLSCRPYLGYEVLGLWLELLLNKEQVACGSHQEPLRWAVIVHV